VLETSVILVRLYLSHRVKGSFETTLRICHCMDDCDSLNITNSMRSERTSYNSWEKLRLEVVSCTTSPSPPSSIFVDGGWTGGSPTTKLGSKVPLPIRLAPFLSHVSGLSRVGCFRWRGGGPDHSDRSDRCDYPLFRIVRESSWNHCPVTVGTST
jgi:hypothetical protein